MTLKTLKDIEGIDPHFEEDTGDYVFNGDIKAEAVKCLNKDVLDALRPLIIRDGVISINDMMDEAVRVFIRWFFNITEEDLE